MSYRPGSGVSSLVGLTLSGEVTMRCTKKRTGYAAAQIGVLHPIKREQRAFHATEFAQNITVADEGVTMEFDPGSPSSGMPLSRVFIV